MKKLITLLMSLMIVLSMAGCSSDDKTEKFEITDDMTVVEKFDAVFKNMAQEDGVTAETMLQAMKEYTPSEMSLDIMEVEEVYSGFNDQVTGFDKATLMAPMISVIPFICYIFEVNEDVDGFVSTVTDLANPNWNICVSADDLLIDNIGSYVLVVMAPTSFDE